MKFRHFSILILISFSISSCNSFFNKGSLYVPVSSKDLKNNINYKSIKELDSLEIKPKTRLSNAVLRDSILKRNQKIVDRINEFNSIFDSSKNLKEEQKLYTLQEINQGKFVKTYYKRDLRKKHIAYTKKKLSTKETIIYALGLYFAINLIMIIVGSIALILLYYFAASAAS